MFKYSYFEFFNTEKNCPAIKAISSYEGKKVVGIANLHPDDVYNYEKGKKIARLRCKRKLLKKKRSRFLRKANDVTLNIECLMNTINKMRKRVDAYKQTAFDAEEAMNEVDRELDELLNNND